MGPPQLHIAPAATLPSDVVLRVLNAESPMPSLENPIFNVDINISKSALLAALKRWPEAEEYF